MPLASYIYRWSGCIQPSPNHSLFSTHMRKHYVQFTQRLGLLLLWTSLFLGQTTFAQSIPDAQWARVGRTLTITNDGNIATGETIYIPNNPGFPGQGGDRLVKYSLRGDQIWSTGLLRGGYYLGGKIPGFDYESIGRIHGIGSQCRWRFDCSRTIKSQGRGQCSC